MSLKQPGVGGQLLRDEAGAPQGLAYIDVPTDDSVKNSSVHLDGPSTPEVVDHHQYWKLLHNLRFIVIRCSWRLIKNGWRVLTAIVWTQEKFNGELL
jgi:hypothetical protein